MNKLKSYSRESIINFVNENNVRFIRLQFTDIFGSCKNVAITKSQLKKALDNKCMFDGSSIEGFVRIEESDMYLYPDLSTFTICPWQSEVNNCARLICDVHKPDLNPFEGDPRIILKNVIDEAKSMGFTFNVGSECEFFLFHTDKNNRPTNQTIDSASYFDLGPVDKGEDARREICLALEDIGFEIEASHHECAPGQHEIDFKYSDALNAADNIITFKIAVKAIAAKHGLHATFMPKPLFGVQGSGMHINMSLSKNGENIFYDPLDPNGLSKIAYNFIAGLMRHARGMACVTNPLVNSYKRLVTGFEAPVYIAWSTKNRSPLIRIPEAKGESTRIELRNPDPSANPYLVLAVCLAAGLEGIKQNLTPPDQINSNVFNMTNEERHKNGIENLPESLARAIDSMRNDQLIRDTLGSHAFEKYLKYKHNEWAEYRNFVTQWELDNYLCKY